MTLDDLSPTNTFELRLIEILKQGVPVGERPSDAVAEALGMMAEKIIKLDGKVTDLERRLEAIKTEIIKGAG